MRDRTNRERERDEGVVRMRQGERNISHLDSEIKAPIEKKM